MIYEQLLIQKGVTAVIGSGGKTTLLRVLARQLPGTVIVATSTHIFPMPDMKSLTGGDRHQLAALLASGGPVCLGEPAPGGKLTAPSIPFDALAAMADYVLVEADGSKGLPLKAHLPHEPVIPPGSNQVICLVGLRGVNQPIRLCAHRPALYASLAGCAVSDSATPAVIAKVLLREGLHTQVVLNQADTLEDFRSARELADKLPCPVFAGSLQKEELICLSSSVGPETSPPASPCGCTVRGFRSS